MVAAIAHVNHTKIQSLTFVQRKIQLRTMLLIKHVNYLFAALIITFFISATQSHQSRTALSQLFFENPPLFQDNSTRLQYFKEYQINVCDYVKFQMN